MLFVILTFILLVGAGYFFLIWLFAASRGAGYICAGLLGSICALWWLT